MDRRSGSVGNRWGRLALLLPAVALVVAAGPVAGPSPDLGGADSRAAS